MMHLETKAPQGLLVIPEATGQCGTDSPSDPPEETHLFNTLISDIWFPELLENRFLLIEPCRWGSWEAGDTSLTITPSTLLERLRAQFGPSLGPTEFATSLFFLISMMCPHPRTWLTCSSSHHRETFMVLCMSSETCVYNYGLIPLSDSC